MARFFCFGNLHSECKLPNKIQKKKEMEVQNFMPTLNLENRTQTTKKNCGTWKELSTYF